MDLFSYLLGKKSSGGGGTTTGLDFTELGFSDTPEGMQDKFDYALNIKETWIPSTYYYNKYANE